jgi:hypothetical protein
MTKTYFGEISACPQIEIPILLQEDIGEELYVELATEQAATALDSDDSNGEIPELSEIDDEF